MTQFESAARGPLEGSHGGRAHVRDDRSCHRATPLSRTRLTKYYSNFKHKDSLDSCRRSKRTGKECANSRRGKD